MREGEFPLLPIEHLSSFRKAVTSRQARVAALRVPNGGCLCIPTFFFAVDMEKTMKNAMHGLMDGSASMRA